VAGVLHERLHTRDLADLGGLWPALPRLGAAALVLAMASLGLPGLGNFVAEVLILMGAFRADLAVTAVATGGRVPPGHPRPALGVHGQSRAARLVRAGHEHAAPRRGVRRGRPRDQTHGPVVGPRRSRATRRRPRR
jgi:hypothetical protein